MPISMSEMPEESFLLALKQAPMAPDTFSSREHLTSSVALNAILKCSAASLDRIKINQDKIKIN